MTLVDVFSLAVSGLCARPVSFSVSVVFSLLWRISLSRTLNISIRRRKNDHTI